MLLISTTAFIQPSRAAETADGAKSLAPIVLVVILMVATLSGAVRI